MARRGILLVVTGAPGCGATAVADTLEALGACRVRSPEMAGVLDDILTAAGSGWDDPLPLSSSAFSGRHADACHDAALEILAAGEGTVFVVEDPRLCRLLPLWRRIAASAGLLPVIVVPLRHPASVALRLRGVTTRPREMAPALWLGHMLAIERDSRGLRRVWLNPDTFIADPRSAVEKLVEKVGTLAAPAPAAGKAGSLEQAWAEERAGYLSPEGEDVLPAWADEGYRWFLAAMVGGEPETAALDCLAARVAEAERLFGAWLGSCVSSRQRNARTKSDLDAVRNETRELRKAVEEGARRRAEAEAAAHKAAERVAHLEGERDALSAENGRMRRELDVLAGQRADFRSELDRLSSRLDGDDATLAHRIRRAEDAIAALARMITNVYGQIPLRRRLGGLVRALWCGRLRQRLAEDRDIAAIARSGRFDAAHYLRRYNDIAVARVDPIVHYVRRGAREGRNPHPAFDTRFYLETYPDVALERVNPFAHYVRFGIGEGRVTAPGVGDKVSRFPGLDPLLATTLFEGGEAMGDVPTAGRPRFR